MSPSKSRSRSAAGGIAGHLVPLLVGLVVGGGILPAVIYAIGVTVLGRYEGGSLMRLYQFVLAGLTRGSAVAWAVLLGPWLLYLLARLLRGWWCASARHA